MFTLKTHRHNEKVKIQPAAPQALLPYLPVCSDASTGPEGLACKSEIWLLKQPEGLSALNSMQEHDLTLQNPRSHQCVHF